MMHTGSDPAVELVKTGRPVVAVADNTRCALFYHSVAGSVS